MTTAAVTSEHRSEPGDVELLADESGEGFRAFFDRHVGAVFGFLVVRVGPGGADDLVSETFAIAWTKRATYRADVGSARSWLYGIAANVVRQHRDLEARWLTSVEAERSTNADAAVAAAPEIDDVDPQLAGIVASLPPSERDVLLLVATSGMSATEAARHLEISTVAARVRLHRARRKVVAELQKELT
jgi:RNA polymerase sigma-70 factor (ECF subfamily)